MSHRVRVIEGLRFDRIPFDELFAGNEPVLMRGLTVDWPLVQAARESPTRVMDLLAANYNKKPVIVYVGDPEMGGRFSYNESLTGSWDITYMPSGDKGVFTLRQSGTLLVGEYVLEGGWRGSLQGTIVSGKVLLHRIDSKLGHSQDLEGTLSTEGRAIRGNWQNFILSGGQPASGNWVAQKRERADS